RPHAKSVARQQDRRRHASGRRYPPRHNDARRSRGAPDAHRGREHRRRGFFGVLADQAERRRRFSIQHPESGRHREGRGRERHARSDRPLANSADPDRRAADDRRRRSGSDAAHAGSLRRRRADHTGAAAEGRPARPGHRRVPRRAGGAHRRRARAERGADLRQPGGAGEARGRSADHPGGRSLSRADGRRGDRPGGAIPEDLRSVPERPGGDAPTHVSGDDGAAVRRHRQDHRGHLEKFRQRRGAVSAAERAAASTAGIADRSRQMRFSLTGGVAVVLAAIAIIAAYGSLYTVYQTQQALVVRLGQPGTGRTEPGLYAKWPLIDSVIPIDRRILDLESPSQEVIASDQKRLVVDAFARYRVQDPLKFYQTVGSIEAANSRLSTLLISALRRVLGEASFIQVVRDERPQLTQKMREQLDHEAAAFGIAVVDVRIRRADLPEQNSQAVFQRMQTERQREAAEFRAQGSQRSQEIRARADRDVIVLVAEA